MAQPRLIGELAVVALEAENLPKVAAEIKPFCVFRLGGVAKRTKADYRGGRNPQWDDQVNMPVPHGHHLMRVQVLSEDPQKGDFLICEGEIDLTKVLKEGEHDDWIPLKQKGQDAGDVYLELTFYSANPPPRRQPTRFGHPRPPQMAGFARPPMPNQYPRPVHPASAPVVHMGQPPRPGPYTMPPQPRPYPLGPVPLTSGGPPPSQPHPYAPRPIPSTSGGPHMPGRPMSAPPPPPPPHVPHSTAPSPVAVNNQWRTSSSNSTSPRPPAIMSPVQQQPPHSAPAGAPLLSAPFRPPPRPSYSPGNPGYPPPPSPGSYPGKSLPNYPPEHYAQSAYPHHHAQPSQLPAPHPQSYPQQHPQSYPQSYPPPPQHVGYPHHPPGQGYPPPRRGYPPY